MIHTVSNLAATYDTVTNAKWPENITPAPPGLPGGQTERVTPEAAGGVVGRGVSAVASFAEPTSPPMMTVPAGPAMPTGSHPGGGLDPMMLATAGTAGLGLLGTLTAAALPPAIEGEAPPGRGGLTSTFGGTKGAPSVLGREGSTETAGARTGTPTEPEEAVQRAPIDPKTGRPMGQLDDEEVAARARPGSSTLDEGRAAGRARVPGQLGEPEDAAALRGQGTLGAEPEAEPGQRPAYLGGKGLTGTDEEDDERLTWLTEDEMVWGQNRPAAPPILGNQQ
jgi:hypothetical protein